MTGDMRFCSQHVQHFAGGNSWHCLQRLELSHRQITPYKKVQVDTIATFYSQVAWVMAAGHGHYNHSSHPAGLPKATRRI